MIVRLPNYLKKAGIISSLVFLLMVFLVAPRMAPILAVDNSIENTFTNANFGFGDVFMNIVSIIGSPIFTLVIGILLAVALFMSNLRIPAIWVIGTIISGNVVAWIIKHVIARARPLGHLSDGFSFPSGHSFGTWMIITIFFVIILPNLPTNNFKRISAWILITFGLLVMESRLYLLDHFLSDVIAGAALGISWVILTTYLYTKFAQLLRDKIKIFEYDEI
ncbi:MAG: phosphatase PAP2 family protein [Lactobacillaceae bacterium]|jgi:membrane-associated phospholipid phosphatase|nr:phosphatase PAP2 family protein [Lactobacillaceae bacterium]